MVADHLAEVVILASKKDDIAITPLGVPPTAPK